MADAKPKSSKRDLWFKFGRFITGVTIACFFLPFFGVSCEGMDVVNFSGADMVGGCKPGGLIADAQQQKESRGGGELKGDITIENVEREPLAIAALGLALVVAGLSWVRSKKAMFGAFALSLACIGALAGLYLKVGGDLDKAVEQEVGKTKGSRAGSKIMKETKVEAGSRFGLWLTVAGLLGVAALTGLALKEPDGAPLAPPVPPPA
jgi:hypothetical protein